MTTWAEKEGGSLQRLVVTSRLLPSRLSPHTTPPPAGRSAAAGGTRSGRTRPPRTPPRTRRTCRRRRAAVVASIVSANPAVAGGVTRSASGTNSSVSARPPGASAACAFAASRPHVGRSKWCRKFVSSTTSYGPPQSTSKALPGSSRCRSPTPSRFAFSAATASTFGPVQGRDRAFGYRRATAIPNSPCPAATSSTRSGRSRSPPTSPASSSAGSRMSGPIARANDTQTGLSWDTVPSAEIAVPPLRTAAGRSPEASRNSGVEQELERPAQVGRGVAVEEGGRVRASARTGRRPCGGSRRWSGSRPGCGRPAGPPRRRRRSRRPCAGRRPRG